MTKKRMIAVGRTGPFGGLMMEVASEFRWCPFCQERGHDLNECADFAQEYDQWETERAYKWMLEQEEER